MSNTGARKPKISIKPFKHQVQMDPEYATKTWKLLKNAINEIHQKNASGLSFEELYRYSKFIFLHQETLTIWSYTNTETFYIMVLKKL